MSPLLRIFNLTLEINLKFVFGEILKLLFGVLNGEFNSHHHMLVCFEAVARGQSIKNVLTTNLFTTSKKNLSEIHKYRPTP